VAGHALIAGGYPGPPPLTVTRVFTSWTADPLVLLAVLLACGLYLAGLRRVRARGERWPPARAVAFIAGGAGTVAVATMSFLGVYQAVLFSARAVQTVLLLLVAPLLLALGRPLSLLAVAWPAPGRRVLALVGSRAARVLTFPALTALVLVTVPFVLYFSPWYRAGLTSGAVRELTYLALLAPGLVFFWTLLRVDPVPKAYPYLVSLWVTGAEVVGDAVLGLAILADEHLIAGSYYRALGRPWGPALKADQVLGGGALWLIGDLVGLPFLAALLIQMMREDEREAARVDTELDAAPPAAVTPGAAAVPAGPGAAAAGPDVAVTPAPAQPWWEEDPRFTGRFQGPDRQ
jgi:cytochrome c oxidase assembly factor CtaG